MAHEKARITPYIHILVYNVPKFIKDEQCLKSFTGQGNERVSGVVRASCHKENIWHKACKEAMQALRRIDNASTSKN